MGKVGWRVVFGRFEMGGSGKGGGFFSSLLSVMV